MGKFSDFFASVEQQAAQPDTYLEIDKPARAQTQPAADPAGTAAPEERSVLKDTAGLWGMGTGSLVKGIGWLFNSDELGKLGQSTYDYWAGTLSETQKAANQKKFVNDDWSIGDGLTDINTIFGTAVQSLPHMVPGMGAAGLAGRGALALGLSQKAASLTAAAGGTAMEGVTIGAMVGQEVDETIRGLSEEDKMQSPYYADLRKLYDEDEATDRLSRMAANPAALKAGIVGSALGVAFNKFLGDALTRRLKGGPVKEGAKGFVLEAGTEAGQSGMEAFTRQDALNEYAAQPMSYTEIVNEMVGGTAAGGVTGAAVGVAGGLMPEQQPQTPPPSRTRTEDRVIQARQQAEAAGYDPLEATNAGTRALVDAFLQAPTEQPATPEVVPQAPMTEQGGGLLFEAEQLTTQPMMEPGTPEAAPAPTSAPQRLVDTLATPDAQSDGAEIVYDQDGIKVQKFGDRIGFEAKSDQFNGSAWGATPDEARRALTQLMRSKQPKEAVLQNRDRSRPAYVEQMQAIANAPDYDRVSVSREPNTGAPMVFQKQAPEAPQAEAPVVWDADKGATDTVTMSDGKGGFRKVPVQYAVIEADAVTASNNADGTVNEGYGKGGLTALNNGRTAGLQAAYAKGTAQPYVDALLADTAHGIAPEAIRAKSQPLLIRLFDEAALEGIDDPGAASNVSASAELSAVEQAQTDARKLDMDLLNEIVPGDVTGAGNMAFVRRVTDLLGKDGGGNSLRDAKGLLTAQGQKRIKGALVERAYEDQTITQELTEAVDNDLKTLGDALAQASGRWALMRERAREQSINPDMDITDALVSAVNMIRKSRQEGKALADLAGQVDAFAGAADQMAVEMLHLFYHGKNFGRIRAKDTIAQILLDYVDAALASSPGPDMFGEKTTPQSVLEAQREQIEGERQAEAAPGVQPDGADDREAGPAGERPVSDPSGQTDAGQGAEPESEPESEIAAAAAQADTAPTDAQKEAGNYRKGHIKIHGLDVSIENPKDSLRSGTDPDGKRWERKLTHHYGYLKRTVGADGDQVDVFIGPNTESETAFIVDQLNPDGTFDEHKVMLGFANKLAARRGYASNYNKGWKVGPITQIDIDEFKAWLKDGDTRAPVSPSLTQPDTEKDFDLSAQTEQELAEQARKNQEAADTEARRKREEEQRADADEQLGGFTLTGSSRPADVAMAAGQDDMFVSTPASRKAENTEAPAAPLSTKNVLERLTEKAGASGDSATVSDLFEAVEALGIQRHAPVAELLKTSPLVQSLMVRVQDSEYGPAYYSKDPRSERQAVVINASFFDAVLQGRRHTMSETDPAAILSEAILHELVHGATHQVILGGQGAELRQRIEGLQGQAKQWIKDNPMEFAGLPKEARRYVHLMLGNLVEFPTYALTNKASQDFLQSIPSGQETVFTAFIRALKKALGFSQNGTLLDDFIALSEEAVAMGYGAHNPSPEAVSLSTQTDWAGKMEAYAQQQDAIAADWASRQYKQSKQSIDLEGDGPRNSESISVNSVNEKRRRRRVNDALRNAKMARELATQDQADVLARYGKQFDRVSQWPTGRHKGDTFENNLIIQLNKEFAGEKDSIYGENTLGAIIHSALEPEHKAATKQKAEAKAKEQAEEKAWQDEVKAREERRAKMTDEERRADDEREGADLLERFLTPPEQVEQAAAEVDQNPTEPQIEAGITWKKDGKRIWRADDGQIITDESFTAGGVRTNFFPVYASKADRDAGNNYVSGESLAEAKAKAQPAGRQQGESKPAEPVQPAAPIEDFGEKIEGARKDYASKLAAAKEKDVAAVPLSESWPDPDYQKLLDSGADPEAVAFAHAARDEVPPKPRKGWKLSGWAQQVEALRNFTEAVLDGDIQVADMREFAKQDKFKAVEQGVFNRADLYAAVGHSKSLKGLRFANVHYTMYEGKAGSFDKWQIERIAKTNDFGNMPRRLVTADTKEQAIEQFRKLHESMDAKGSNAKNTRFDIYASRHDRNDVFIGKKIGRDVVRVKEGFTDAKEARAYLAENQDALERILAKMKHIPNHRKASNAPRVGKDHRDGGDVTPEAFSEAFGFRGVQFGNYVEQGRRQQDLNEAYDGLMDLAGILNIPARALSLNGELGLAFGARGKGGKTAPKAHYEPNQIVINLTKKDGAGSLAHEWFHALDNYFARERGGKSADRFATRGEPDKAARPEVIDAFRNIRQTVNRIRLRERSQKLDRMRTKAYWSTDVEMTARAFESYVIEKLRDQGASNEYLANIVSEEYWKASEALGMQDGDSYPYPEAAEIPEIRAAYDNLFEVIETREGDGGNVALFSRTGEPRFARNDPRFMFVGPTSRTANFNTFVKAEDLEEAGKSMTAIRAQTGWWKGADGQWRYEISDHEAKLAEDIGTGTRLTTVGQLLDHPALFQAYPNLEDMAVLLDDSMKDGSNGYYSRGTGITLNTNRPDNKVLSTLLHEIQHAIQSAEGYASGGNSDQEFTTKIKDALSEQKDLWSRRLQQWFEGNEDLVRYVDDQSDLATYGLMYQSAKRLMDYANSDRPSGMLRHIRNEMGWVYSDKVRNDEDLRRRFDELERNWYNLPKRHKMRERNLFLRDQAGSAAQLIREAIPRAVIRQFDTDDRKLPSMVKALERKAEQARKQLAPMTELKRNLKAAEAVAAEHRFSGPFSIYQALAGEIEARNTQARQAMNDDERRRTHPEKTADIPQHKAIVIMERADGTTIKVPYRMDSVEYRRTQNFQPKTMTAAEVRGITNRLMRDWKDRPGVTVADSISEFPKDLRTAIRNAQAESDMRGVLWENHVYILASRIPNRAALEEVILHEAIGHYGLRKMLGDDLKPLLSQVYLKFAGTDLAKKIARDYYPGGRFDAKNLNHRLTVAEELLAHMAETGEHNTLWNRIVGAIRAGLRRLGFTLDLNENDLLSLLRGAQLTVENGGISRPSQFDTQFRRAYHGTPHRFDKFSLEAIGTGEGAQAYGWGLYFAGKREIAEFYRDAVTAAQNDYFSNYDALPDDARDLYLEFSEAWESDPDAAESYRSRFEAIGWTFEYDLSGDPINLRRTEGEGNLYEVEIPDDSELLDWNKRLDDQPPGITDAVRAVTDEHHGAGTFDSWLEANEDGGDFREWSDNLMEDLEPRAISQALNEKGVPGLRYLDAVSRIPGDNGKTHNYVIWDESVVSVQAVNDEIAQAEAMFSRSGQKQTNTEAFRQWFGDSKVVDENGEPLKLYHGTGARFAEFDAAKKGAFTGAASAKEGFFFTTSHTLASQFREEAQRQGMDYAEIQRQLDALSDERFAELASDVGLEEDLEIDGREFATEQMVERLRDDNSTSYVDDRFNIDRELKRYIDSALFERGEIKEVYLNLSNPRVVDVEADSVFDDGLIAREMAVAKKAGNDGLVIKGMTDSAAMDDKGNLQEASDVYVAFDSNQIKSATDNAGTFDPANPDIRFSRTRPRDIDQFTDLDEAQRRAFQKIAPPTPVQRTREWLAERTNRWQTKLRQGVVDRYAALMEVDEAVHGKDVIENSIASSSWVLAQMAGAASGALQTMLTTARIHLDPRQKVILPQEGSDRGLNEVLQQLGSAGEVDRFFGWIAGNRAMKLMEEGRENLFEPDEAEGLARANQGTTADGQDRAELYDRVFEEFQQYRDDILQIADAAGLLRKAMEEDEAMLFLAQKYEIAPALVERYKKAMRTVDRADDEDVRDMAQARAGEIWGTLVEEIETGIENFDEEYEILTTDQRDLWANDFYVPFYRESEREGQFSGPMPTSGLSRQKAYERLKGGTGNLRDLLENTMLNFHHLLQASLKNQAAIQAINNAEALGIAQATPESARDEDNSTFILRDGRKVWYNIDDPLVYKAITALAHPGMNSSAMKAMRGFKRLFTNLTTTTPQFVIANLLRDSMQASATSEVSKNMLKNMAQGSKAYGNERFRARMLASGGAFSFGHLYGENADEVRLQLTGGLSRAEILRSPSMIPAAIRAGWRHWNEVTNFTENINRAAIYQQNMEAKGDLYAAFKSRDLMNFAQHGAWPAVRILIDVVPFLNARLQGLDKIYRSGVKPGIRMAMGQGGASDKQAMARFWTVTGAVALATVALFLRNKDDEEYQKLEDWQKDSYWFIRTGKDSAIFIPKPFEVGAIATLIERLTEQAVSDTATGELFAERLGHMLTSTFSFSPVPQMVQPALDVYANYDAFTGRPIESVGMERLSPSLRTRGNTTSLAKGLSKVTEAVAGADGKLTLSPVQIDHMISGYFGSVGAWVAGVGDTIWKTANGEVAPDKFWYEYQPVKRFYKNLGDEDRYTRYGTVFYEALKETNRVYADIMEYQALGDLPSAVAVMKQNRQALALRQTLNRVQRQLTKINQAMEKVYRMPGDSAFKRRELDRLRAMRNQIQQSVGRELERIKASGS